MFSPNNMSCIHLRMSILHFFIGKICLIAKLNSSLSAKVNGCYYVINMPFMIVDFLETIHMDIFLLSQTSALLIFVIFIGKKHPSVFFLGWLHFSFS